MVLEVLTTLVLYVCSLLPLTIVLERLKLPYLSSPQFVVSSLQMMLRTPRLVQDHQGKSQLIPSSLDVADVTSASTGKSFIGDIWATSETVVAVLHIAVTSSVHVLVVVAFFESHPRLVPEPLAEI